MAWAFKYYSMRKKPSALMELMQDKLHSLTWEESKILAEEIGVTQTTLWYWRSGYIMHGSGLVMSLLCQYFGIIEGERPQLSEDEQIALEIRYRNKKKKAKAKEPAMRNARANVQRKRMHAVR